MQEGYFHGSPFFRNEALLLYQLTKRCVLICDNTAVPPHSSRTCGLDQSVALDVLANVRQCSLTDMSVAPHVQRGSFTFGRRAGGLAPHGQDDSFAFGRHAGKYRLG